MELVRGETVAAIPSPEEAAELQKLEVRMVQLDVTDPESVAALKAAIGDTPIDALLNNAGYGGHAVYEQATDEAIRAMYDTNVFGVMNVTRAKYSTSATSAATGLQPTQMTPKHIR